MKKNRCIAIVGMAVIFPGAPDLPTYWRNILDGVDAISDVPPARWDASYYHPDAWSAPATSDRFYCHRGGFVDDFATFEPTRFGIMPVAVDHTEPDQLLALRVAADAIADAGGEERLADRERVGVIVGRGGYLTPALARLNQRVGMAHQLVTSLRELMPGIAEEDLNRVLRGFQSRLTPERPEASIGGVPNLTASRIANRLDLRGPAYTVDAACASSLIAVDHAVRELLSGRCDAVIAGGVHHCHDVTLWSTFTQLRALSPSQQIRPFDRRADGILIGEGTGMVVLRRLVDAERDGDRVYAVIRGVGVASDGRATSLMAPRVEGQVLALERAWRATGLDPTEPRAISLLEAHGTATPAGDQAELETLARVFGPSEGGSAARLGLGSVKSMIGHAMPAAGIASLVKAALAIHHRMLPPTLHCDDPHPAFVRTRFRPVTVAEPWEPATRNGSTGRTPRRAGVNAFGFGGINAHVILEEAPGVDAPVLPAPTATRMGGADGAGERVVLLAAATNEELARQLERDALVAQGVRAVPTGGPYRLAIVDPTPRRIELVRKVVAQGRPWRGRSDVWFTGSPLLGSRAGERGGLAFVFPGLEPEFEPRVDDVADHFGLTRPNLEDTSTLGRHGAATVAVGRLLDAALRELGVAPDLLAGHSVGEWSAMVAAGMYPDSFVDEFIASLNLDDVAVPEVVFAALGCGASDAAAAIADLEHVVVSHDNCPHQSVICGAEASVFTALDRLRARGVLGQVMPFRSGYHSPMFVPYLDSVRQIVRRLPLRAPALPIWSATTVAPYPDSLDEIRTLVVRHLVETVRFRALVARLHDAGARVFVQVGPGSLTGFIDDTLRDRAHLAIAANTAQRCGLDQLRRVAAALWVEGCAPRFARLPSIRSSIAVNNRGGVPTSLSAPQPAHSCGGGVHLDLGAPLVRLGDSVAPLRAIPGSLTSVRGESAAVNAGQVAATQRAPDHPVLAEFSKALREAITTAHVVFDAWDATSPTAVGPPAPQLSETGREATVTRVLSLETMPFLIDHCLHRQPEDWTDPSDRHPLVPMTTLLELMVDAARDLVPSATVTGIEEVHALRRLVVAPPVTVTISALYDGRDRVTVTVDGYARGTVVLANQYSSAPRPAEEPLAGERAPDITARQLYTDRWMFHGPRFQGVAELGPIAEDGIRGVLTSLPAPGALLDNAGQLLGYWIMVKIPVDRFPVPVTIDRVSFYAPHPVPGERVSCTVRIRSLAAAAVRADMELCTPDGLVWCRVQGWEDRQFSIDNVFWRVLRFPETELSAEQRSGGWFLASERWRDAASRDLAAECYLNATERTIYRQQSSRLQRQWLLGRIAVKDAVRQWLWDTGARPMFPVEIAVHNDDAGRPRVRGPFDQPLDVSLAHTGGLAVALVRPEGAHGVGIDIEVVEERGSGAEGVAVTPAERTLLDRLTQHPPLAPSGIDDPGPWPTWFTRFWAAKEAVAKAEGTSLQGRPQRFVVEWVDGDRLRVVIAPADDSPARANHQHRGYWVQTHMICQGDGTGTKQYVIAWTQQEALPAQDDDRSTTVREETDGV